MRPDFERNDNDERGVVRVHDVTGATRRAVAKERLREENAFCAFSHGGLGGVPVEKPK